MRFDNYKGYKYVDGGVCASKGFVANGLNCGLNPDKSKNDLGIVFSEEMCHAGAVYTTNKVKAAPITLTMRHMMITEGNVRAIIANSKNANTCNSDGEQVAEEVCALAADCLGIRPCEIIVASTGVIGQKMPVEPFRTHMKELTQNMSAEGHTAAATAIMTTDTVKKEIAVEFEIGGKICHLGGMAKGSGMINPNMATTLNFITSDVAISSAMIQKALDDVVVITYNCLSIDGDTSTNDMVSVMANSLAGNEEITEEGPEFDIFRNALYIVMANMTRMLAADGEGATKLLECCVSGAPDIMTGITVAKSVVQSTLLKCALFGEDANWGRVLCAIGYADADFDIATVDVDLASSVGSIAVCRNGSGVDFSEEEAARILAEDEIFINVNLNQGMASAKAWGCDMTYDYVKINGDYRS